MVVSTQNVDRFIVAAGDQLVIVVCDIRNNIGWNTVGTNQNEVLICTEIGSLEPDSALVFVSAAFILQQFYNIGNRTGVVQGRFSEPSVVGDTVFL